MKRARRTLVVVCLLAAASAALPATSSAATRMNGTFECTALWSDVANVPSGYAIGNCKQGTHMHRTWKSDLTANGYFDGGYVYGNFDGCGWIRADEDRMLNDTAWSACGDSASRTLSDFALATNNGSCAGGCTDGSLVNNPTTCNKYANYRPWSTNNNPTDYVGSVPANSNRLRWRYETRYTAANGSGRYVMVRDTAIGSNDANWVFVPRSCLPSSLPGRVGV